VFGNVPRQGVSQRGDVAYRGMVESLRLAAVVVVRILRWWFGLTYLLVGVGAIVAGPIMIGLGNYGGVYMIVGGPIIVAMGWVVHPWGLQRAMNGQPLLPLRQ
jgi:hypothetical protein